MQQRLRDAQEQAHICEKKYHEAKESQEKHKRVAEQWQAQYLGLVNEQKAQMARFLAGDQENLEANLKCQSELAASRDVEVRGGASLLIWFL